MVERVAAVIVNDPSTSWLCMLGGKIVKRNRVNLTVEIEVRFAPNGPWFKQTHKVPRHVVTAGIFCAE